MCREHQMHVCLSAALGSKGISPNVFPEAYRRMSFRLERADQHVSTLKAVLTVGSRAFGQAAPPNSENFWQESGLNRQRHERSRTSMTTNHTSASHQSTDPKIGSADIWPAWRGADVCIHDCLVHSPTLEPRLLNADALGPQMLFHRRQLLKCDYIGSGARPSLALRRKDPGRRLRMLRCSKHYWRMGGWGCFVEGYAELAAPLTLLNLRRRVLRGVGYALPDSWRAALGARRGWRIARRSSRE